MFEIVTWLASNQKQLDRVKYRCKKNQTSKRLKPYVSVIENV